MRKRVFLERMNGFVPWARFVGVIQGYVPTAKSGLPPFRIEVMLRMRFLQPWNNYSDPAMEEALHDTPVYCWFVGLEAGASRLPDGLAKITLSDVNATLQSEGLLLANVTAIDATLIAAPSSNKNDSGMRDPQMHQTKKGNQDCFGIKAHIGVDADSGLVHTLLTTPANTHDSIQAQDIPARVKVVVP
jgi:IS5 family transposase